MFCDLVDSTGIAAKLDAEEWRDLVGADLDTASVAVVEMGGKVAKKLGDGLMALFGYPVAQENDAERAVRAALAIHWPCCYSERATTGRPQKTGGAISPTIACRNGPCGRVGHGNSVRCRSIWALLKTFAKAPECTMIGGPNGALTAAVEIPNARRCQNHCQLCGKPRDRLPVPRVGTYRAPNDGT